VRGCSWRNLLAALGAESGGDEEATAAIRTERDGLRILPADFIAAIGAESKP